VRVIDFAPIRSETVSVSDKHSIRKSIVARLKALASAERESRSRRAIERLLAARAYLDAKTVMAYVSFGSEFPTDAFLRACLRDGKTLGLPRADAADLSMTVHAVTDLDADLEQNALGFKQPLANRPEIGIDRIGLVVTPGIAYDTQGNRLGRGAGYYDRFLSRFRVHPTPPMICALAFECQIVDAIMQEAHDCTLDMILTEDRTIQIRGEAA
jgi:5-formyltetrahydrofolate cyclo-ligase